METAVSRSRFQTNETQAFCEPTAQLPGSTDVCLLVSFGSLPIGLARAANGRGMFSRFFLRRLFEVPAKLHFPIHPFALQLLLENAECLVDIVVAYGNLHANLTFKYRVDQWLSLRSRLGHKCQGAWLVCRHVPRLVDRRKTFGT